MNALMIDAPTGYSLPVVPRRPDVVYNTPYQKSGEDSRSTYEFSQGFYHTSQVQIQHPVAELKKNEMFRLVLKCIAQFNELSPSFENFDKVVLVNTFGELVNVIINNGLHKVVFEKTPDDSLMLKAAYGDYRIYLEIDSETDEPDGYEAVLNAYHNKKPVFFAAGTVASVFQRFFTSIRSTVSA